MRRIKQIIAKRCPGASKPQLRNRPAAAWRGLRQGRWPRGTGSNATAWTSATQRSGLGIIYALPDCCADVFIGRSRSRSPAQSPRLGASASASACRPSSGQSVGFTPRRKVPLLGSLPHLLGLVRTWRRQHVSCPNTTLLKVGVRLGCPDSSIAAALEASTPL